MQGTREGLVESTGDVEKRVAPLPSQPIGLNTLEIPQDLVERFREACGQRLTPVVKIASSESGASTESFLWDRPWLIVGKGSDCDVRLPHAEISRQHAYFQILGDKVFCADLGSRTGTHWSDGASQSGWVQWHESVSLGPYSLSFEINSSETPASRPDFAIDDEMEPSAAASDDLAGHEIYLDFLNAGRRVRSYRVFRDITLIGSGDGVKIHLSHASVSPVHCSVVKTPAGLWLLDLLSSDGTIVNGQTEALAHLQPGDEFQIGRFLVAVRYAQPSAELDDAAPPADAGQSLNRRKRRPQPPAAPSPSDIAQAGGSLGHLSALNQLARMTSDRDGAGNVPAPVDGLSEQFVLNIVKELGVMQMQALQHAQESMREIVSQLSATYQQRIESLERQHSALRDQLAGIMATPLTNGAAPRRLTNHDDAGAEHLLPFAGPHVEPSGPVPVPEGALGKSDVFDDLDPEDRERWIREQIKTVEAELDKTRRGWGRKLVDILGY